MWRVRVQGVGFRRYTMYTMWRGSAHMHACESAKQRMKVAEVVHT